MVFTYYLYKYPYKLLWAMCNGSTQDKYQFYCGDYLDHLIFKEVQKYLKPIPIRAKDLMVQNILKTKEITSSTKLSFPQAVFMCRHETFRYPEEKILKFGFRHGPYHFKRITNKNNYSPFTLYFVSSEAEVSLMRELGIHNTFAAGNPNLDPCFNGEITSQDLQKISDALGFSNGKKNLLFSATWDQSGMSGISQWYDKLAQFKEDYNIMVTVHPWTSEKYKERLRQEKGICFIESPDNLPYIMLSDVVIGDTSSLMGIACALDKSLISFRTLKTKRSLVEIEDLLDRISWRIKSTIELSETIKTAIQYKHEKDQARAEANVLMFDKLDGKAGERAARKILEYLPDLDTGLFN